KRLYGLCGEERRPLCPRSLCFGVDERTDATGAVERRPGRRDLERLAVRLRKAGVEAVAVSFLHSYANPANEETAAAVLERGGLRLSVSNRLLPEHREYERTTAAAVNAYLMPVLDDYLTSLEAGTRGAALRIMQSNEGTIAAGRARREPIRTALSGPAGGVVAAAAIGRSAGIPDLISFDMGGTSTDVSLVDGRIRRTQESIVGDFPVRLPMIDIHTVGAGGGSIAALDSGGALRVGPASAGADPGPACYGRSDLPTVTDANLVCGRLDADYFLGGAMRIDPERSRRAIARLARRMGTTTREAALGIIDIANANMEKAIRVISIERGFDPRRFALVSFGGAGGMHAAEMASDLGMSRVVIPRRAGVFSALGLLCADAVKDYARTLLARLDEIPAGQPLRLFAELRRAALRDMADDGFDRRDVRLLASLDMRSLGQSYEITVPWRTTGWNAARLAADFRNAHRRLYAFDHPDKPVEVVALRLKAFVAGPKPRFTREAAGSAAADHALLKRQTMHHGRRSWSGAVYRRALLRAGNRIPGPALVIDPESTSFIPPGFRGIVDVLGNLVIAGGR
ncbi:MAG: hydantoinase/oxoprolinase family protein, partial [Candidatus Aminicenantes bacterium]|nr:hydantoinase/oxoprolinase family protein [Candidatus Aminicenantes bacterium]